MNDAPVLPDVDEVLARLRGLRGRIAVAGVDPATVEILAVTKGHDVAVVPLALAAGLAALGENYAQELVTKARYAIASGLQPAPQWHFIGHLQRNKVRQLAGLVTLWQSLDRVELVDEVARRAPGATVLIQVNATGEPQKAGCVPAETAALVERAVAAGLAVSGLMTVGPTDPTVDPRPAFDVVRGLVDRLGLRTASMGMTDDLEAAVRAGSTMIRVGTALFGPRRPRTDRP